MPTNCDNVTTLPPRMPLVFVGAVSTANDALAGCCRTACPMTAGNVLGSGPDRDRSIRRSGFNRE